MTQYLLFLFIFGANEILIQVFIRTQTVVVKNRISTNDYFHWCFLQIDGVAVAGIVVGCFNTLFLVCTHRLL